MAKPTDPKKHAYMFSDDMKFLQKAVVFHPENPKKFLILKRSDKEYSRPGDWDFAGGNVLYGELHTDSLMTELKEEAGLDISEFTPIQVLTRYDKKADIYFLFISYTCTATSAKITVGDEHTEYKWVTIEEFEALEPTEFLLETLSYAIA